MPGFRNISGNWRFVVPWRNIAGTWKRGLIWRNIAGVWKVVAGAIVATVDNSTPFGDGPGVAQQTITSEPVTTSVQYGSGNFTYQWTYQSGDNSIAAINPTAATTAFRASVAPLTAKLATWKITVTDTAFGLTANVLVNVKLQNSGGNPV